MQSRYILEDQIHHLQRIIKERDELVAKLPQLDRTILSITEDIEWQIKHAKYKDDIK